MNACKDCCNYPYCPYLCYFNHDKDVGCVEFIKVGDYRTTVVTNNSLIDQLRVVKQEGDLYET